MGEKKTLCTWRKSENRRLMQPKVSKLILSITKNNPLSHGDQRCDRPVTCQPRVNSQFIGLSAAVSLWVQLERRRFCSAFTKRFVHKIRGASFLQ